MRERLEIGTEPTDDHLECMMLVEKRTWEMALGIVADGMGRDKMLYTRSELDGILNTMLDRYFEVAGFILEQDNE